ncbi:hypothetical protein BKA93DRAFT_749678 [Sparassis latifolia]
MTLTSEILCMVLEEVVLPWSDLDHDTKSWQLSLRTVDPFFYREVTPPPAAIHITSADSLQELFHDIITFEATCCHCSLMSGDTMSNPRTHRNFLDIYLLQIECDLTVIGQGLAQMALRLMGRLSELNYIIGNSHVLLHGDVIIDHLISWWPENQCPLERFRLYDY